MVSETSCLCKDLQSYLHINNLSPNFYIQLLSLLITIFSSPTSNSTLLPLEYRKNPNFKFCNHHHVLSSVISRRVPFL